MNEPLPNSSDARALEAATAKRTRRQLQRRIVADMARLRPLVGKAFAQIGDAWEVAMLAARVEEMNIRRWGLTPDFRKLDAEAVPDA